ncbi:MAG: hypothetical protein M1821_005798 [Bathelium mastoideum]|nr:MAG: hypothetical protein M1821_005798 [Bathelium mastoideum]KAI9681725.1 MAG: hypothetical protein M1822_007077 [Bathelium mastoideum]
MQAAGGAIDYDEYRRRQRTASPAASADSESTHTYTYFSTSSVQSSDDPPGAGTPGHPPPPPEQPQYCFVGPVAYCASQAYMPNAKPPEPEAAPQSYYCFPAAAVAKQPETSTKTRPQHRHTTAHENENPPTTYVANNPESHDHTWFGRTASQVAEDNQTIAVREGVYTRNALVPKDPKDDQFFWVVEPDGKTVILRTFDTIENMGWEGEWKMDNRQGNLYFERKKEEN